LVAAGSLWPGQRLSGPCNTGSAVEPSLDIQPREV
jgi:hypothetical protein